MGRQLLRDADPFWPPHVQSKGRQVGVYVCRFKIAAGARSDAGQTVHPRDPKLAAIDAKILAKYLA